MFPDNLTRAEAQARSALLSTSRYAVEVDLSGAGLPDPTREFVSTTTISFTGRGTGSTHLDLIASSVRSATLDGVPLDPAGFVASRLPLEVTPGEHELTGSWDAATRRAAGTVLDGLGLDDDLQAEGSWTGLMAAAAVRGRD